ncbi:MAG TPA: hypothetical protein VK206_00705 [Anaerolineales bacterium]|nr:hypothetical protein [Anaerolineales bacterium]
MKKKSFKHRLSYFFTPRLHHRNPDSTPELENLASEWERTKSVIEDILRWADDGGNLSDGAALFASGGHHGRE